MRNHDPFRHSQEGFTLVELMVVVALIGVMTSIAIPSYNRFQVRARNSEAKLALAAIYVSETSFAMENGSYTPCLANIGFAPEGATRYFAVGFTPLAIASNSCGPNGTQSCAKVNWPAAGGVLCSTNGTMEAGVQTAYPATANMPSATLPTPGAWYLNAAAVATTNSFRAMAISNAPFVVAENESVPSMIASATFERASQAAELLESSAMAAPGTCYNGFAIDQSKNYSVQAASSTPSNCAVSSAP